MDEWVGDLLGQLAAPAVFLLGARWLAGKLRASHEARLRAYARERGMEYFAHGAAAEAAGRDLKALLGESTRARHILYRSTPEFEVALFELKRRHSRRGLRLLRVIAYVLRGSGTEALPAFSVEPRTALHGWLKGFRVGRAIELPLFERFCRSYHLSGEDETAVRGLFEGGLASVLEEHPHWHIHADRGRISFWRYPYVLRMSEWQQVLGDTERVVREIRRALVAARPRSG